jgi:hypothetical protein
MTWWVQEECEEGFVLSRTQPKYSILLEEEDYETEEDLPGFDKGPEANYGGVACDSWGAVETWDPWEPSYFFLLK